VGSQIEVISAFKAPPNTLLRTLKSVVVLAATVTAALGCGAAATAVGGPMAGGAAAGACGGVANRAAFGWADGKSASEMLDSAFDLRLMARDATIGAFTGAVGGAVDSLVAAAGGLIQRTVMGAITNTVAGAITDGVTTLANGGSMGDAWNSATDLSHRFTDAVIGGVIGALGKPAPTSAKSGASKAADGATEAAGTGGVGPVLQGQAGVERSVLAAEARGEAVIGREVTIETSAGRTRPDLVVRDAQGNLKFIESKCGPSACLTPNQRAGFPLIESSGGIPRGANAGLAGLPPGQPIGPTPVQVDWWLP